MFKITIPTPCHEDWNKMTATTTGAFCKSCAKEVIDFSKMTDSEVQNYFVNLPKGSICGRFKSTQLQTIHIELPDYAFYKNTATWKRFMAIILLAFGTMLFGCNVTTTGIPVIKQTAKPASCTVDSNQILGEMSIPLDDSIKMGTPMEIIKTPKPDVIVTKGELAFDSTNEIFNGGILYEMVDTLPSTKLIGDTIIFNKNTINK